MNVHMKRVKITVRGRKPESLEVLSIRGASIRCILLPDALNLDALLVDDTPTQYAPRQKKVTKSARGRAKGHRTRFS
jgi:small nuclear ribonucleoprotein D1